MPRHRRHHKEKQPKESTPEPSVSVAPSLVERIKKHVKFRGIGPIGKQKTTANANGATANGDYYLPPSGRGLKPSPSMATLNRLERQKLVLWRHPITTLNYFARELLIEVVDATKRLWANRRMALLCFLTAASLYFAYVTAGPHQIVIAYMEKKFFWCLYWIGLGILSSIGLGTGLHTFLLYLGPHIASVTLAAYECDSVKFPEPPYPDEIICPYGQQPNATEAEVVTAVAVSLWSIVSKVRLEAFMWGAGTALGELPPYFMARAARLSGEEPDDEEYREFKQFLAMSGQNEPKTWVDRLKVFIEKLVERVGFLGILLCASIPNPVFDLAGITCGHFLVPFWTFFGATLIGKAIVKMHIQKLFVIVIFSEHHVENVLRLIGYIPKLGQSLQAPFEEYLIKQKTKLHRTPGDPVPTDSSILQVLFGWLVAGFVFYFLLSIVNSLAQSYHKRKWERQRKPF